MDLGRMAEILEKGGASQEEIAAALGEFTQKRYEEPTVTIVPDKTLESLSPVKVSIGNEKHALRELNGDDVYLLVPYVIGFAEHFIASGQVNYKNADALLKDTNPEDFFKALIAKVLEIQQVKKKLGKHEYPLWLASFFELVAHLASTQEREITKEIVVGLKLKQQAELYFGIFEVIKADFLDIWVLLPENIRSWISTLKSKVTTTARNIEKRMNLVSDSLGGGASATLKTSSSSRSKKQKALQKASFAAAP